MLGILVEPLLHLPPRFLQLVEVDFLRLLSKLALVLPVVVPRGDDESARGHDHSPVAYEHEKEVA